MRHEQSLSSRSPGRPKNDLAPPGGGSAPRDEPGAQLFSKRRLAALVLSGGLIAAATPAAAQLEGGHGGHGGGLTAVAELEAKSGSTVQGKVLFHERPGQGVHIAGRVIGLTPGRHGFHIHANGNCDSADGMSAGGHYSPYGGRHGAPTDQEHHLGDLGNIVADADGVVDLDMLVPGVTITLMGLNSIGERSIIIHASPDDYSDPAGNSGPRVACGFIDLVEMHMRM